MAFKEIYEKKNTNFSLNNCFYFSKVILLCGLEPQKVLLTYFMFDVKEKR